MRIAHDESFAARHPWKFSIITLIFLALVFAFNVIANGQSNLEVLAKVKLGELLFFDPALSADGSVACATCHVPEKGYSDGRRTAVGILGQEGQRHTPTIYTAAFHPLQFPDGRTLGVDTQSLLPLTNPIEMGNGSVNQVVNRIDQRYDKISRQLYGRNFDASVLADAMARYEGSIFTATTPCHRRLEGYSREFADDPAAERGFQLFVSKGCVDCHVPPLFTDMAFHNTGITFVTNDDDQGRIDVLPQGTERTENNVRAFKTPSLQGINVSAPYTHAGNVGNLETMVRLYNAGMVATSNGRRVRDRFLDPRIRPLGLSESQIMDLTHFLEVGFVANVVTEDPRRRDR